MAGFTQQQLDAIEASIADGTLTVKYADKQVTYRSLAELIKIRDMIRGDLGTAQTAGASSRVYPVFSKGLE